MTGGVQARLLSSEITELGLPTLLPGGEGNTVYRAIASGTQDPRSLNRRMYASSLHGNREIPRVAGCNLRTVRSKKAKGRTFGIYTHVKSDGGIVSMKRTNKGAQPRRRPGQPPAEIVEKRPPAEGNRVQPTVTGTQGPAASSSGLAGYEKQRKTDTKVDPHGSCAAPLPESTFLRLTRK